MKTPQEIAEQIENECLKSYEVFGFDKEKCADIIQPILSRAQHLEACVQAYDAIINKLPKDELVRFANQIPEEYRAARDKP